MARILLPAITTVLTLAGAAAGWSSLPLFAAAALPWFMVAASRLGSSLAIAVTVIATAWVALMILIALPALDLPIRESFAVLATVAALVGWAVLFRRRGSAAREASEQIPVLASLLGPSIIAVVAFVTAVGVGGSRLSWAMRGDAASNLLFARGVLASDGILIGPEENPAPLPSGLIALAAATEHRLSDGIGEALRADVVALAAIWCVAAALVCLLAGISAAGAVSASHPVARAAAGASVSLLPLSWFVTGFATEAGYVNVPLSLTVLLASAIAARAAGRTPVVAIVTLALACTVMLAIWAPLAVIPLALAMVALVRNQQALVGVRGPRLVAVIAAVAQLAAFGTLVSVPSLLAQSDFVTIATGPRLPVAQWYLIVIVAVAVIAVFLATRSEAALLAVVLAASTITAGGMLFANRLSATPWAYYPSKFVWIAGTFVVILSLGLFAARLSRLARAPFERGVALTAVGLVVGGALLSAPLTMPFEQRPNVVGARSSDRMLLGGDKAAEAIFELATTRPTALLRSGLADEGAVSFWLLRMGMLSVSDDPRLHALAYRFLLEDEITIADICALDEVTRKSLDLVTADSTLSGQVVDACAGPAPTVRLLDDES